MQARRDDCEHRITYREHDACSVLNYREQDFVMIASTPPDECKRLQLPVGGQDRGGVAEQLESGSPKKIFLPLQLVRIDAV